MHEAQQRKQTLAPYSELPFQLHYQQATVPLQSDQFLLPDAAACPRTES